MAVTLPLVLLLLDWWPLNRLAGGARRLPALLAEKAPLALLAAAASLVALQAQASGGAVATRAALPAGARAANAVVSLAAYPARTALPFDLAVYYPAARRRLDEPAVLFSGALALAATLAALRARRRRPWLLAGWTWYLATVLPVLGLVQVGAQASADRYTYLPLIGPVLALVWACAARPWGAARAPRAIAAAAVAVFSLMTARQATYWRDALTLYGRAVAVTAGNQWALYNLGLAREADGDREGAARAYREAIRLGPAPEARYGLALALAAGGDAAGAAAELRAAVRETPADPLLRWSLAELLLREGDEAGAVEQLRELVRQRPGRAEYAARLEALLAGRAGAPP